MVRAEAWENNVPQLFARLLKMPVSGSFMPLVAIALLSIAAMYTLMSRDRDSNRPQSAHHGSAKSGNLELSSQAKRPRTYSPTAKQWEMLTVETVLARSFRPVVLTEGKISLDEDRSTPVFSPYAGRVTRLAAKPGEFVKEGEPLFFIEASEMIQAQNDFMSALATLSKAKARVALTDIVDKQNRRLLETKAGSLRDSQVAETELAQARSELRVAEVSLEASRNRLRILGKTDQEIDVFQDQGRISPDTPIYAPIAGTVVSRKVGPGQYVSYTSTGSLDPSFVIGNLSTVWVVAYVRESDTAKVRVGQPIEFKLAAHPDRTFRGTIDYAATSLDLTTRRLMVRATVSNDDLIFKPEMFASVSIFGNSNGEKVAVPRDAVIFEAGSARVWVVKPDRTIEERNIATGLVEGAFIEVLDGLKSGESVISKGGIFVDRAADS
jgi:membrane fusion protein, heavy metal efflux system